MVVIEDDDRSLADDLAELSMWNQQETPDNVHDGTQLTAEQQCHYTYRKVVTYFPGSCQLTQQHMSLTSDVPVRQRLFPVPYAKALPRTSRQW